MLFSTILDIFEKTSAMKKIGILFFFIFISYFGTAQEIPAVTDASSEFIIKRIEIIPSLSILSPEIPNTGNFKIRSVNFDPENESREVNMAEFMARERRMKSRTVQLAPPVQLPQKDNSISVGRNTDWNESPRFFNQSFSPELPGSGTRNAVYRNAAEGTGHYYLTRYNPFARRGYNY